MLGKQAAKQTKMPICSTTTTTVRNHLKYNPEQKRPGKDEWEKVWIFCVFFASLLPFPFPFGLPRSVGIYSRIGGLDANAVKKVKRRSLVWSLIYPACLTVVVVTAFRVSGSNEQ